MSFSITAYLKRMWSRVFAPKDKTSFADKLAPKVALISPNCAKYSETFIRAQVHGLPQALVLYCGAYLPLQYSKDRGETFEKLASDNARIDLEKALAASFRAEQIDVALAQYGPTAVAVLEVCKSLSLPLVVHFHGYDAYRADILTEQGKQYAQLFDYASALVSVSADMTRQLIRLGAPQARIHEIPYGVDTDYFTPGELHGNYFLYCGRFVAKKNPDHVVRAFAAGFRGTKEQLRLIGDGPLLEEVRALVNALELTDQVIFEGVQTPAVVKAHMQQALALILPSSTTEDGDSEGTPLAILEASACGVPVLSTRHAGIPEAVIDGVTGILVEPGDVDALARAMQHIHRDKEAACSMGIAGRAHIVEHFQKANYLGKLSRLLDAVRNEKVS
jgi:glycosyltransferase involved in cell wall biosynthesis